MYRKAFLLVDVDVFFFASLINHLTVPSVSVISCFLIMPRLCFSRI